MKLLPNFDRLVLSALSTSRPAPGWKAQRRWTTIKLGKFDVDAKISASHSDSSSLPTSKLKHHTYLPFYLDIGLKARPGQTRPKLTRPYEPGLNPDWISLGLSSLAYVAKEKGEGG